VLTLVGPGGVGKARLALHIAQAARERFADGATFVDLTPLRDPALVLPAIAQALGLQAQSSRPASEALTAHLANQQRLLVLDNCEHLLDAAPEVAALRAACPGLRVLATSRVALRVRGEQVYPVPPLATPDPNRVLSVEALGGVAAVTLFVQQARAALPTFTLTAANAATVAAICARVDGLPLAIELAAARVEALPLAALLARLSRPLGVLVDGPRDAPVRQRTLRDTVAWSYDLLPTSEQVLFRRLAVFVSGGAIDAVQAVCRVESQLNEPLTGMDVAEGLAALTAAHLLRAYDGAEGEPRYTMLATIREYALERLEESGEGAAARVRHAAYYLGLAEEVAGGFDGRDQLGALETLEGELDNVRAALAWCVERGAAGDGAVARGLAVAAELYPFWIIRSHTREAGAWLARLLDAPGARAATPGRARSLALAAAFAFFAHDVATARARRAEALSLSRALDDPLARAYGPLVAGTLALFPTDEAPDPRRAWAYLDEALALFEAVEPRGRWETPATLMYLGAASVQLGEIARARDELSRGLALAEGRGNAWIVTLLLDALGGLAWGDGDVAGAEALYGRMIPAATAYGDTLTVAYTLYILGQLAEERGDAGTAWGRYAQALTLVREAGDIPLMERTGTATIIMAVAARQRVPARALHLVAVTFGLPEAGEKALTLEQAITAAVRALDDNGPAQ